MEPFWVNPDDLRKRRRHANARTNGRKCRKKADDVQKGAERRS
jgi:hypothetical protein